MICDLSDSSVGGDFSVVDDGVGENEKKGFPAGGSGAISPVLWVWVVKFSIPVWPENMEDEEQEMGEGGSRLACCFSGVVVWLAVERKERGGRWCDGDPVVCCPAVEKERVKAEGFAGSYGGMMVFWSFSVGSFPAVDDEGGEPCQLAVISYLLSCGLIVPIFIAPGTSYTSLNLRHNNNDASVPINVSYSPVKTTWKGKEAVSSGQVPMEARKKWLKMMGVKGGGTPVPNDDFM
ncbi:hypothetical protein HAX54_005501 [Datura stramonium]|uniref:Uncharacterized protein n=1 Tax=Datura stramonium TaxID=4076 RepID=A0ABS8TBA2_DATST|nr:hypothetical protein [Datura stramonium]